MNDSRKAVLIEELDKLHVKRVKKVNEINEKCPKLTVEVGIEDKDLKAGNSKEKTPEQIRQCEELEKELEEIDEEINRTINELNPKK